MNVSQLDKAKRAALNRFDEWNEVTGFVVPYTGYYAEITGLVEDAVEIGVAYATDSIELLKKSWKTN